MDFYDILDTPLYRYVLPLLLYNIYKIVVMYGVMIISMCLAAILDFVDILDWKKLKPTHNEEFDQFYQINVENFYSCSHWNY